MKDNRGGINIIFVIDKINNTKIKIRLGVLIMLLSLSIKLSATNYYVNTTTGNNINNGTSITTAKKDFTFCNGSTTALAAGDTVFIMNGTYLSTANKPILKLNYIGTAAKPIVFTNYKNHTPVFKYIDSPNELISFTWATKTAYVVINGLKLEGNNAQITLAEAMNQTNNCLNGTLGQPTQAKYNVDGFGLYDNGTGCGHITISNCDISNFPGGGIATGGLDYFIVENCKVYNNGWYAIDGNSGISVLQCKNLDNHVGVEFSIIIRNNIAFNNINYLPWNNSPRCNFTDGNGIIIDHLTQFAYNGKVLVENNICYDNGGGGIQFFKSENGTIRNNTLYKNGKQDGYANAPGYKSGEFSMYNSTNVKLYNNIIFPIPGKASVTSGAADITKVSGNNIIASSLPWDFTFSATDKLNTDPQFVNAAAGDFRLKCTSPAYNGGTNAANLFSPFDIVGTKRPNSLKPDVGAYEINCAPLPVVVIDYSITTIDGKAEIKWSTANEEQNDYFKLERSKDGIHFDNFLNIKGRNNNSIESYSSIAPQPFSEDNYYRLSQIDIDGNEVLLGIRKISFLNIGEIDLEIFPNPSNGNFNCILHNENFNTSSIQLFDQLGQQVYEEKFTSDNSLSEHPLSLSQKLKAGIYTLKVTSDSFTRYKKIILN